jgi:hypothetical protein
MILINMFHVSLPSFDINQNNIKEDEHKFMQKGMERIVDESLKGGWGIERP